MRRVILAVLLVASVAPAVAQRQVQVDGHIRKDGTYVPPHYRTAPDSSRMNNWSTDGNINPYTGQQGSVNPYQPPGQYQPQPFQPYNGRSLP